MKRVLAAATLVLGGAIAAWAQGPQSLSVIFGTEQIDCPNGDYTIAFTIATGAASEAQVTATLTDQNDQEIYSGSSVIPSGAWNNGGSIKSFDTAFHREGLAGGTYTLEVCAMQNGRLTCATKTFIINCNETNPCATIAPFGEVVGNKKINSEATAQIQFKGDFGSSPLVEIRDSLSTLIGAEYIPRNGESCTYHANWKFTTGSGADFYGNTGKGAYVVTVDGNGNHVEFSVNLN